MDDLTQITGIGKATADRLVAAGITTFQQLAHDAVAGENGVKAEWIAAAAASLPQRPEARPDASGAPKGTGSPSASADPAGDAPEGTNFTDTPPSDDAGGAGVRPAPQAATTMTRSSKRLWKSWRWKCSGSPARSSPQPSRHGGTRTRKPKICRLSGSHRGATAFAGATSRIRRRRPIIRSPGSTRPSLKGFLPNPS
jgi:hypothetical protein